MASLFRPKLATYVINEKVTIDTTDREDHTFCGITFPIQCKSVLPVDHIVINSISVRGALGPLTVWITKPDAEGVSIPKPQPRQIGGRSMRSVHYNLRNLENNEGSTVKSGQMIMKERYWDKIYEKTHSPSYRQYCKLDLGKNPIILKPGEIRGIYIHSTHESDQAIVYDNQQKLKTHDDQFLTVLPGRSHVSPKIFGNRPIWGWGNAWRDNREFVGKINYGVVYKLWNPSENLSFGGNFRSMAHVLFMCQRRWESPVSMLCDECIFYILNMCRWDWMGDDFNILRIHRKKVKALEAVRANEADDENDEDSVDSGGNADNEIDEVSDNEGNDEAVVTVRDTGSPKAGLTEEVHLEQDEESYDSDYGDGESGDDSDSDDGNDDHRGSSMFQYVYYDDCGSSDEEREAEIERQRQERRRLIWLRNNFAQHFRGIHVFGTTDDDGDDNDDDDYS